MRINKKECVAMLLAGGQDSRLFALTNKIAKPAAYIYFRRIRQKRARNGSKARQTQYIRTFRLSSVIIPITCLFFPATISIKWITPK